MELIHRRGAAWGLFVTVLLLSCVGVVMVYSASAVVAQAQYHDSAWFLKRQLLYTVLGLVAMSVAWRLHYARLRAVTVPLLALTFLALLLVLVPHIGREAGGARRWLSFGGPLNFQPAELAKLTIILYLANFLANRRERAREFAAGLVPPLVVLAALALPVVKQPDLGSALILALLTFALLFVGGANLFQLFLMGAAAVPVVMLVILHAGYRASRLFAFLDPWKDPQGTGFHIIQSLLALGSGGILGLGLGHSRQKFFYLPERHTDFIFSIIGEELGLHRHRVRDLPVPAAGGVGIPDRVPRAQPLRRAARLGPDDDARGAGGAQHRRRVRIAADHGGAAAVHQLRGFVLGAELHRGRDHPERVAVRLRGGTRGRARPGPAGRAAAPVRVGKRMNLLFCGGGTGGHVYPALALVESLQRTEPGSRVLFAGSALGMEARLVPEAGVPFVGLLVRAAPRPVARALRRSRWRRPRRASRRPSPIVRRFRPDAIVATGGLAAIPVAAAGVALRVPVVVVEGNMLPGRVSRVLARWSRAVAVARGGMAPYTGAREVVVTGLPVREEIYSTRRADGLRAFGLDPARRTLLVLGGSQGAARLNAAVEDAVTRFAGRRDLQVLHVTGGGWTVASGRDERRTVGGVLYVRASYVHLHRRRVRVRGPRREPVRRHVARGDHRGRPPLDPDPVPARGRRPSGLERRAARGREGRHPPARCRPRRGVARARGLLGVRPTGPARGDGGALARARAARRLRPRARARPERGPARDRGGGPPVIAPGTRVHFVGIGGAGMSAIASVLLARGYPVSGSDLRETDVTRRLRAAGARIQIGHAAEHLAAGQVVVISRAVPEENVEIQAALAAGTPDHAPRPDAGRPDGGERAASPSSAPTGRPRRPR